MVALFVGFQHPLVQRATSLRPVTVAIALTLAYGLFLSCNKTDLFSLFLSPCPSSYFLHLPTEGSFKRCRSRKETADGGGVTGRARWFSCLSRSDGGWHCRGGLFLPANTKAHSGEHTRSHKHAEARFRNGRFIHSNTHAHTQVGNLL